MSLEIKDKFFDYLTKDGFFEEGNIKDFIFFAYEDSSIDYRKIFHNLFL